MASNLTLEARPVPLDRLPDGTLRVAGTRIGFDLVIDAYKHGLTPAEIVAAYDSLRLADVYALIAYYLDHPEEVEEYLREYEARAAEVRRMIEAAIPPRPGFREELRARWARREAGNAPNGDGR
jgi:uncharacterized protein (DUF433 family)